MDLDKLKSNLKYAIPLELYQIEADRVTLFISKNGISQRTSMTVTDMFRYFRNLYKDNNVTLSFFPTDNEALIDKIAARLPQEDGTPDKVVIGTWDTIAGFASQFFGEDINKIIERVPILVTHTHLSISADKLPVVITINPEDCPVKKAQPTSSPAQFSCPFIDGDNGGLDMGLKIVKPESGSKAEKALKTRMERKLEKVLRDCAILDIELDVDRIKQKVINSLKSTI